MGMGEKKRKKQTKRGLGDPLPATTGKEGGELRGVLSVQP